jgi:hypothetical protein
VSGEPQRPLTLPAAYNAHYLGLAEQLILLPLKEKIPILLKLPGDYPL